MNPSGQWHRPFAWSHEANCWHGKSGNKQLKHGGHSSGRLPGWPGLVGFLPPRPGGTSRLEYPVSSESVRASAKADMASNPETQLVSNMLVMCFRLLVVAVCRWSAESLGLGGWGSRLS